jgi:hypothetical protein
VRNRGRGEGIGGLRQISICRQVPFLVNFKEKPTFRICCLYRYLVHGGNGFTFTIQHTIIRKELAVLSFLQLKSNI